jgi:hypothetical protein
VTIIFFIFIAESLGTFCVNILILTMVDKNSVIKVQKFVCKKCDVACSSQWLFDRHSRTNKHKNVDNLLTEPYNSVHKSIECICGKTYNHRQSLSLHKKKCLMINQPDEIPSHPSPPPPPPPSHSSTEDMQMNIILELVKQNQEFKDMLIQQSAQMMEQNKTMMEVAKNSNVNNTISNSNNNSNNKTFNLNFFLNETCKDAMNMKDFIKSLEMSLPELEKMGDLGFAEGMSRVFVDRLNKLDITKRPIHCSDVKREIIHIKEDNKWEMDNANLDRLRKIIKQLTIKNILKVDDWKKANQGCTEYNSRKNAQYLKINMEAIGPVDEAEVKRDFGKIIRRVAESTAIDKKYLCI